MEKKALAEQMARHIEQEMSPLEKKLLPAGQPLVDDILDWMERTDTEIRPGDTDTLFYVCQYELDE